jgi:dihydroorotase
MSALLIRGVTILALSGAPRAVDLRIAGGTLAEIARARTLAPASQERVVEGDGLLCCPGFVDIHVHLREPGQSEKETLRTGSEAAARGGFTRLACMPNTRPVLDSPESVRDLYLRIAREALVPVHVIAAITRGSEGQELTDFAALKAAGAVALSDDGRGVQRADVMRAALHAAAAVGLPILAHCEDESLSAGGAVNEGMAAESRCLLGIPAESEVAHVARDLALAERSGAHYHVCHMSCADSARLIREARRRGVRASCEVAPHHLLLVDADIPGDEARFKMNPPLRSTADRDALIEALLDGTVDAIATDHAPHTEEEKARGLKLAPFGVIGLETAFPLLYTHLCEERGVPIGRILHLLGRGPAELLGLPHSTIRIGERADLVLLDLESEREVSARELRSKGRNTPFMGRRLRGWPVLTLSAGRPVFEALS